MLGGLPAPDRWCAFPVRCFRVRNRPWDGTHSRPHHRWIRAISPRHSRPPFSYTCPHGRPSCNRSAGDPDRSPLAPPRSACTPQAPLWSPSVPNHHPWPCTPLSWPSPEPTIRHSRHRELLMGLHRGSIQVIASRRLMCQSARNALCRVAKDSVVAGRPPTDENEERRLLTRLNRRSADDVQRHIRCSSADRNV